MYINSFNDTINNICLLLIDLKFHGQAGRLQSTGSIMFSWLVPSAADFRIRRDDDKRTRGKKRQGNGKRGALDCK